MPSGHDAIIIGAGPAGLACAMAMRTVGLDVVVLEKAATVGSAWRRHYDRLHLHTDRNHSALPGLPMPREFPTYPSRGQVVDYLDAYAAHFGLKPVFNTEVSRVVQDGARWRVETSGEADGCSGRHRRDRDRARAVPAVLARHGEF